MTDTTTQVDCWKCSDAPERPAILVARDHLAAGELGDDLNPEHYAAIQAAMWRHPFSRAAVRVWTLQKEGELVATFETLDVTTRMRGEDGAITTGRGFCIASGFVAPNHRLSGHGRRLAGALSRRLIAGEGYEFYYGVVETTMKVYSEVEQDGHPPIVDVVFPSSTSVTAPAPLVGDLATFTSPPLLGSIDVLLTREMLEWRLERVALERPQDRDRPVGAVLGSARVVWVSAPERDALEVLHLRGDAETGPRLIDTARREAADRGLGKVVCWENPRSAAWLTGARHPVDAVLAVKCFREGLSGAGWHDAEIGHYF